MNWFQRHLNWTLVITSLAYHLIVSTIAVIFGPAVNSIGDAAGLSLFVVLPPAVLIVAGKAAGFMTITAGFLIAGLTIGLWWVVFSNKRRSLWWVVLASFIPLGWIVLLCLENRNKATS